VRAEEKVLRSYLTLAVGPDQSQFGIHSHKRRSQIGPRRSVGDVPANRGRGSDGDTGAQCRSFCQRAGLFGHKATGSQLGRRGHHADNQLTVLFLDVVKTQAADVQESLRLDVVVVDLGKEVGAASQDGCLLTMLGKQRYRFSDFCRSEITNFSHSYTLHFSIIWKSLG
jgi:hypothetical protein